MMKKVRVWGLCVLLSSLLFGTCNIDVHALSASVDIVTPSDDETLITLGRDFYVSGTISGIEDLTDTTMEVKLKDSKGDYVREIVGRKASQQPMKINFPNYYGNDRNELKTSGMPELIWDGVDERSFYNGDIKCYFDNNKFNALIIGGSTDYDNGLNFIDKNGNSYSQLTNGNYILEVSVLKNGIRLADTSKVITIGATSDKLMARFSPASHLQQATMFAQANHIRMYLDAFPGYYSKNDLFCEILKEWRGADAQEYASGKVHFIIYNIKSTSATYAVELAMLQRMQDVDNPQRLVNYYYEYGEPLLNDKTTSEIVPFEVNDKLQLVRAEIANGTEKDNVFDSNDTESKQYDLNLEDGVNVEVNQLISLYGVSAPIQNDSTDIIDQKDNSYQLKNKIQYLHYVITGDNIHVEMDKEVKLNRIKDGWDNYSELEFKHDFKITEAMQGKQLNVQVRGYDAHNQVVVGSEENFQINVKKTVSSMGVETKDNTNITLYFSLFILSGVVVALKFKKAN